MPEANSTVLVIDDDVELRNSLGRLLRSVGFVSQLFASVSDFLKSDPPEGPTCLVLDVRLQGQSGLDLQRELAAANRQLPIIFITAHGDIPMSVQAIKAVPLSSFRNRSVIRSSWTLFSSALLVIVPAGRVKPV